MDNQLPNNPNEIRKIISSTKINKPSDIEQLLDLVFYHTELSWRSASPQMKRQIAFDIQKFVILFVKKVEENEYFMKQRAGRGILRRFIELFIGQVEYNIDLKPNEANIFSNSMVEIPIIDLFRNIYLYFKHSSNLDEINYVVFRLAMKILRKPYYDSSFTLIKDSLVSRRKEIFNYLKYHGTFDDKIQFNAWFTLNNYEDTKTMVAYFKNEYIQSQSTDFELNYKGSIISLYALLSLISGALIMFPMHVEILTLLNNDWFYFIIVFWILFMIIFGILNESNPFKNSYYAYRVQSAQKDLGII